MPNRRKIGVLLLPVLAAGFLAGVVNLFLLRFEAGDVYPPYSSLRSDPLGAKVLYESLASLAGLTVGRNFQPVTRLRDLRRASLFFFGVSAGSLRYLDEDEVRTWETLLTGGGRIVILLSPERWRRAPKENGDAVRKDRPSGGPGPREEAKDGGPEKDHPREHGAGPGFVSLGERWKFRTEREQAPQAADRAQPEPARLAAPAAGLPKSLSWHSALFFEDLGDAWRTVYSRDGRPVLIERAFGRGTIVLAADSYFVSNEAMQKERHPELLAWLAGQNTVVVVDETHHGIAENPGVAALGRAYRLHGLFAALIVLALLFLWKNTVSLVPPAAEGQNGPPQDTAAGKDSLAGFTGLLRRSIPARDILAVCVDEWKKTALHHRREAATEANRVQAVLEREQGRPPKQRDPVRAYRTISTLLAERKRTP